MAPVALLAGGSGDGAPGTTAGDGARAAGSASDVLATR
jgi:hypothetical protein